MRIFRPIFGMLGVAVVVMIQVPSNHATSVLAGWFRDGSMTKIADWLDNPAVDHFIRSYAVWVLLAIAVYCLLGQIVVYLVRYFWGMRGRAITPDIKVSDAVDYIVNDSVAILQKPQSLGLNRWGLIPLALS